MLTSIISTAAIAPSIVLSMMTDIGISEYEVLVVIVLIYLLYAKEILSASRYWTKSMSTSFNMTIFTLIVVFAEIVIFKIAEML